MDSFDFEEESDSEFDLKESQMISIRKGNHRLREFYIYMDNMSNICF